MDGNRFPRVFALLERRRNLVIGLLCTILALAGLSLLRIRFDNTLDLMLPTDSPAQRMMAFLRDANFICSLTSICINCSQVHLQMTIHLKLIFKLCHSTPSLSFYFHNDFHFYRCINGKF